MPMSTERRRLYRSATTPVGTSNRKHEVSKTVPTSTSWKGPSPTTSKWYTIESTVAMESSREKQKRKNR